MSDLKRIIWLASYPKSGNTWFRVFLTNLLRDVDKPANINELEQTPIASARAIFDDIAGVSSSDLSHEEIDLLRPEVYWQIAEESNETVYQKVHDAYTYLPDGRELFPNEVTKAAIYFIRNPLDVAVSFAHHSSSSFDKMISSMHNMDYAFCSKNDRLHNQLRQKLLTWTEHYKSWKENPKFPVHIMKYEDMKENTFEVFKKAVEFIGLEKNDEQIKKAIKFSSFEVLTEQEKKEGFKEKAPDSRSFFRKGKVGSWQEELNEEQINQIIIDHGELMRGLNYL